MARYIDADALIEDVGKIVPSSDVYEFASQICNAIKNQPTAYNIDTVVAELEKESYQEWCDSPRIVELKDAIEIVRKGGVHE